jgi:glycosyltransferase involved in cell wall biosynthesis
VRVLFFYQYFGTPKGSWSTRVYELTRRWVKEGHEVTVVTAPYDKSDIKPNGFISRQQVEGVNLIVINSGDSNRLSVPIRVFRALRFALVSMYYALSQSYDIAIASSGPITIGLPMVLAKKLRRKKTVFEVRDLWPAGGIEMGLIKSGWQKKMALWFEELCYKNSDLIVPCSQGMEASIVERFPKSNTLVIPNASDPILFKVKTEPPKMFLEQLQGRKVFIYAGSLGLMDDCAQIVSAMSHLTNLPIDLVFIGDGAERASLEKIVKETGNKNIHFLGLVPKTEVVKWFSVATASFVTFKDYPVLHTSSPNKMFDSFAAGVPIIQSTKGWIKELVNEEMCGLNVPPDNSLKFADSIVLMAQNEELRNLLAMNAKKMADIKFNRDLLAQKYLSALTNLHE